MMKVSDYVIQYLEQLGVPHMFMLPGGGAMHLNDSLGNSKKSNMWYAFITGLFHSGRSICESHK